MSFTVNGEAGPCPVCGKNNVTVLEHIFENHYALTLICPDCGVGDHFDGTRSPNKPNKE